MVQSRHKQDSNSFDIVVVGGGSAGITTAARLVKQLRKERLNARILIIDPAENHYYQPIWTLVGAGVYPKEVSTRKERDLIPSGVISALCA
jgi:sulfide:quinone oxidoreductase